LGDIEDDDIEIDLDKLEQITAYQSMKTVAYKTVDTFSGITRRRLWLKDAKKPGTDGHELRVPFVDPEFYRLLEQQLSHVLFKTDAAAKKLFVDEYAGRVTKVAKAKGAKVDEKYLQEALSHVITVLEMRRVGKLWGRLYPGSEELIREIVGDRVRPLLPDAHKNLLSYITCLEALGDEVDEGEMLQFKPYIEEAFRKVDKRGFAATMAVSKWLVMQLVNQIIREMKDLPDPEPPQPMDQGDMGEEGDEQEDTDSEGSGGAQGAGGSSDDAQGGQDKQDGEGGAGGSQGQENDDDDVDGDGASDRSGGDDGDEGSDSDGSNQPDGGEDSGTSGSGGDSGKEGGDADGPDLPGDGSGDAQSDPGGDGEDGEGGDGGTSHGDGAGNEDDGSGDDAWNPPSPDATGEERAKALEDLINKLGKPPPQVEDTVSKGKYSKGKGSPKSQAKANEAVNSPVNKPDKFEEQLEASEQEMDDILDAAKKAMKQKVDHDDWLQKDAMAKVRFIDQQVKGGRAKLPPEDQDTVKRLRALFHKVMGRRKRVLEDAGNEIDVQAYIEQKLTGIPGPVFRCEGRGQGFKVMLLFDRSGSMSGQKTAQCERAARIIQRALKFPFVEIEMWGFTAFEGGAITVSRFDQREEIWLQDSDKGAGGYTPLHVACRLAGRRLTEGTESKSLIVLTDGLPMHARRDGRWFSQKQLMVFVREELQAARKKGVNVTGVLLGENRPRRAGFISEYEMTPKQLEFMFGTRRNWRRMSPDTINQDLVQLVSQSFLRYLKRG
jgi:hypothetical protein